MPVVCLQVGQCGNQLGHALWQALERQAPHAGAAEASVFFHVDDAGGRRARCLMVDTEPKVVNSVLQQDRAGLFPRRNVYLGHSGRGNNWAFGYHQSLASGSGGGSVGGGGGALGAGQAGPPGAVAWNPSTQLESPGAEEHRMLEHVMDGLRSESEACDGTPDFLLLHSLGGGSGSGLGARLLEALRDDHGGLANVVAASVAPHPAAGESPMQCVNAALALGLLHAYADAVLLFDNREMMDAAAARAAGGARGGAAGAGMADVNAHIAGHLLGALWPMEAAEAYGGTSRVRDIVSTVAADPCCKLLDARTTHVSPGAAAGGEWASACRGLHAQLSRYDALDGGRPVVTSGSLLLARGFPSVAEKGTAAATAAYVKAGGGAAAFLGCQYGGSRAAGGIGGDEAMWLRTAPSSPGLAPLLRSSSAGSGGVPPAGRAVAALASVSCRSSTAGLLDATAARATEMWRAGAYMHWYERHGCSSDAVRVAIESVNEVADCYRAMHGTREWLDDA